MKFNHVVCGGTFDHFHLGHKKLLDECFFRGKTVTVGITNEALIRHKTYVYSIEKYDNRVKNVLHYQPSFKIFSLSDIYGPTLTDETIDAICVTKDTLFGAEMINKKRKELGMKALFIIMVPFVYDENNEKICSERIREGIENREGKRYDTFLFSKENHILPNRLREVLRKPLGHVISSISSLSQQQIKDLRSDSDKRGYTYLCVIGDMVTLKFKKSGILSFLSIVDGLTQRKALNSQIIGDIIEKEHYNAINEKGMIQKNACIEIQKLFDMGHKRAVKQLYIQGEEDLLTLAAVLLAPLDAHIWYGQRGVGAVDVRVTEKIKHTVYNLLRKFD